MPGLARGRAAWAHLTCRLRTSLTGLVQRIGIYNLYTQLQFFLGAFCNHWYIYFYKDNNFSRSILDGSMSGQKIFFNISFSMSSPDCALWFYILITYDIHTCSPSDIPHQWPGLPLPAGPGQADLSCHDPGQKKSCSARPFYDGGEPKIFILSFILFSLRKFLYL